MEEVKGVFRKVTDLMEQDNRGVQLGCYSVALVGLTIAIRRVRPFSRFKKPSDIPNHFIQERRELTGLVERVEPNGGLLMIRHKPLVPLPFASEGELPVKISGVNVGGLGLTWLQTIVAGSEVKFVPVAKTDKYVHCEVLLPQITKDKKPQNLNIGESLVRIGFGRVQEIEPPISTDKTYLRYCNKLYVAEDYALRRELGIKYYVKPTKSALSFIGKQINKLIQFNLQIVRSPKLAAS